MSLVLPAGTRTRPAALDLKAAAPILPQDPLEQAERSAGLIPKAVALPLPPSQAAGLSTSSKRPFDHSVAEGTLARGKRPKAVKFRYASKPLNRGKRCPNFARADHLLLLLSDSPSKGKRPARVVAGASATATSLSAPVVRDCAAPLP